MNFIKRVRYYDGLLADIKNLVSTNKVVHISDVPSSVDIDKFYIEMGDQLGMLFRKDVDPATRQLVHDSWTIVKYDVRYLHDTYKHSNKAQPLHTDYCNASIALDVVELICVEAAPFGGATIFMDSILLLELLKKFKPGLMKQLQDKEVIFGKAPHPLFRNTARVISYDDDGPLLYWNYAVVAPDNTPDVLQMCEEFHDFLESYVVRGGLCTPINLAPREGVFMQDKRILHGRNSFLGDRHLLKGGIATKDLEMVQEKVHKIFG